MEDYYKWLDTDEAPLKLPRNAYGVYKRQGTWVSWPDFLGTTKVKMTFEQVVAVTRTLGLKKMDEYRDWVRNNPAGKGFPLYPESSFKNKGWKGMNDFLGIKPRYRSFEEAVAYIADKGLRKKREFRKWVEDGNKPDDIPSNPDQVYDDWISWPHFLNADWLPYEEAKALVQAKGIKSKAKYIEWSQSDDFPLGLPAAPERVYKGKGWEGSWRIFLGTALVPFEQARETVRALGFEDFDAYRDWVNTSPDAKNFPLYPETAYKGKGYTTQADFLGTAPKYRPLVQAQACALYHGFQKLEDYQNYVRDNPELTDLPLSPISVYAAEGLEDTYAFLGTGNQPISFEICYELMKLHQFQSGLEFNIWLLSERKPKGFPLNPEQAFRDSGWVSWPHFIGIPAETLNPRPADGAQPMGRDESTLYLRLTGIESTSELGEALESGSLPGRFSSFPQLEFGNSWKGWLKFLNIDETPLLTNDN